MKVPKRRRKFLGCGCSTWLLGALILFIAAIIGSVLSDTDAPAGERSAPVPTFTATTAAAAATPIPATETPPPLPTSTPIPPAAPAVLPAAEQRSAPAVPLVPDASLSDCPCDSDSRNCGDFPDPFDAQACYLRCLQLAGYDVHGLDRDSDGDACEWGR